MSSAPFIATPIDSLIDEFFASLSSNQTSSLATYVLSMAGQPKEQYFKYASPEITDQLLLASPGSWHITAVYTDGTTRDVTKTWADAIEKRRDVHAKFSSFLEKYSNPPETLATYELLVSTEFGHVSLGYFVRPSRENLRSWALRYQVKKLAVRAISKTGEITDVTNDFKVILELACRLR